MAARWDAKTLVIVDEAAMLDSRITGELLSAARISGANDPGRRRSAGFACGLGMKALWLATSCGRCYDAVQYPDAT
jgi:hypothetical protein